MLKFTSFELNLPYKTYLSFEVASPILGFFMFEGYKKVYRDWSLTFGASLLGPPNFKDMTQLWGTILVTM